MIDCPSSFACSLSASMLAGWVMLSYATSAQGSPSQCLGPIDESTELTSGEGDDGDAEAGEEVPEPVGAQRDEG